MHTYTYYAYVYSILLCISFASQVEKYMNRHLPYMKFGTGWLVLYTEKKRTFEENVVRLLTNYYTTKMPFQGVVDVTVGSTMYCSNVLQAANHWRWNK